MNLLEKIAAAAAAKAAAGTVTEHGNELNGNGAAPPVTAIEAPPPSSPAAEAPPKRKRGRPRKDQSAPVAAVAAEAPPKRRPGRPRKVQPPVAATVTHDGTDDVTAPVTAPVTPDVAPDVTPDVTPDVAPDAVESVTLEVAGEIPQVPDTMDLLAAAQSITGDSQLTLMRPDWQRLAQECVNVRLSISFWRANAKLDAAKLGLDTAPAEFAEFAREYLKLGNMRMMPARYWKPLESIEERSRQLMSEYGFRSPWGGYLVPLKGYAKLRSELESRDEALRAALNRILAEYDEWVSEVRSEYRKLVAVQFAVRAGRKAEEAGSLTDAETEAINAAVEAIVTDPKYGIKTRQAIESEFLFAWLPSYVEKPALLGEGTNVSELEARAAAAKTAYEALQQRIETSHAELADRTAHREAELKLQALQDRLEAEKLIARDMAERAAGAQLKEIAGLLDGAAAKVAGLLYQTAKQVRANVSRSKSGKATNPEGNAKTLLAAATKVRQLVAWEDPSVERMAQALADLATDLQHAPKEAQPEKIDRVLADVQALMRADLIALGNPSGEDLEIPSADLVLLETNRDAASERLGLLETSAPTADLVAASGGGDREL